MIQKKYVVRRCKLLVLFLGILALSTACGDKKQANEDLQQAFELHKEAVKIRQMMQDQMTQLKANMDSLFVETHSKDLNSISSALEAWDEQLVEVPGFEEEHDHSGHDHDHDHDHHHDNHPELTPKQHLEVQQHLLEEIKEIAVKIDDIKE
ncbi:hypothetical protein [Ulvibacterium sp.]|uniref:hypothetical protein n=1 Tax=Ulvibacterium sp. TaxID=2665914 RepID=UPI0026305624|nr:hypothetical protein [Ulvibacterium sp.]